MVKKSKRKGGRKTGKKWSIWDPLSRRSSTSSEDDFQAQEDDDLDVAAKMNVPGSATDSICSSDVPRETPIDAVKMGEKGMVVNHTL